MKKNTCPHCQNKIPQQKAILFCPICGLSLLSAPTQIHSIHKGEYASLGSRLLARLLDYTIIGIIACLIDWITQGSFIEGLEWFRYGIASVSQVTYSVWTGAILFLGYFVIFQSLSGQTPGKKLCQIVVLQQSREDIEKIPGFFSNLVREAGIWITWITGGWLFLLLLVSPKNRGFHDFLSRVEVYQIVET
ncbi:MAG: RDD family protein [SAR324 cluster bacterium]|nr:RDD family protein [SAR324 cluster bacterium]